MRTTRAALAGSCLALAAAMLPQALGAQTPAVEALTGLRSVSVVIEQASAATVAAGVDTVALRTRVEDTARRLGLTVLAPGARDSAAGVLYLNVFAATNAQRDWYAAHVEVEVMQPVTIDRTPDARLFATTWHAPVRLRVVRQAELAGEIRQVVGTMLDEFARAWSGANPAQAR